MGSPTICHGLYCSDITILRPVPKRNTHTRMLSTRLDAQVKISTLSLHTRLFIQDAVNKKLKVIFMNMSSYSANLNPLLEV